VKVLVTGACGFLARELISVLEQHGHDLLLLDFVDPKEATVFVPGALEREFKPLVTDWPYVRADVTDVVAMQEVVEGIEGIIHLSGLTTGLPDVGVPTFRVNALGTFVVLDTARKAGVSRVICASSINAFGTFYWRLSGKPVVYTKMPLDESFPPVPEDPYSLSKLVNEETCAAFTRAYGITTAAMRFAGVWSHEMYEKAYDHLEPTTSWNDDLYSWVHVTDIVEGLRTALEASNLPESGVYTLSGVDTRCPEPTMQLLERFRPDLARTVETPLKGHEPLLSIQHAREAFGYAPRYVLASL
jgi:nucleoside-diphosphate-sugar epimerase